MASILWLAGHYFRPPDNGMYRYSLDITDGIAELGHDVTLLARRRSESEPAEPPDNWILLKPRNPPMARKLASPKHPVKVVEIWNREYHEAVVAAVEELKPDLVVFNHLRVGAAIDSFGKPPCFNLTKHDEVMVRTKMMAEASGLKKAAFRVDLTKLRHLEDRLIKDSKGVSAISQSDVESLGRRGGSGKTVLALPVYKGQRLENRTITDETPRRVAIISTLFWDAKIGNLLEALEGLKPLTDAGVELTVFTGGYPPAEDIMAAHPKVKFEGFVPDFQEALDQCRVGLVYEPIGGGFKLKTLDFIFHRVPLVVGAGSADSLPLTPGKEVIEVPDRDSLAGAISAVIDDLDELNRLQSEAYEACRNHFSLESLQPLSDALEKAAKG
jgi:glycosyltransferase involved in cell wall biosynthesis